LPAEIIIVKMESFNVEPNVLHPVVDEEEEKKGGQDAEMT